MKATKKSDRRRHLRWRVDEARPIRVDINGDDFVEILRAVDISEGGIGISVAHRFKGCNTKDLVNLVIELPAPQKGFINVSGRIMHVSGDSFGITFSRLSYTGKMQIRNYISEQLKKESFIQWLKYKLYLLR